MDSISLWDKKCGRCHEVKPREDFYTNTYMPDGRDNYCKACRKVYDYKRTHNTEPPPKIEIIIPVGQKQCSRCGLIKDLQDFSPDRGKKTGRSSRCRACKNEIARFRHAPNAKPKKERRADGLKQCNRCGKLQSPDFFSKLKASADGLDRVCRACKKELNRATYTPSPRTRADASIYRTHLRRTYGMTMEEYESMREAQGGVCAVCGLEETAINPFSKRPKVLAVDHDHETGQIRGLLCSNCNRALGMLKDDIKNIESLLAYMRKWKGGG